MKKQELIDFLHNNNIISSSRIETIEETITTTKELKEVFEKMSSDTSTSAMQRIENIDKILHLAFVLYDEGNQVMDDYLYDGQNGIDQLWKSCKMGHPSKDKSFYNLYVKEVFANFPTLLDDDVDEENLPDFQRRMREVLLNPTTAFDVEKSSTKTQKELSKSVLEWVSKTKRISESLLTRYLNDFQKKMPVVGEEGSTIVKATDREEINNTIKDFGVSYYGPKLDGASGYIHYKRDENANFVISGLYGRGGKTNLTNITYKYPMIKSIPKKLMVESEIEEGVDEVEIRGEIIIKKIGSTEETLDKINMELTELGLDIRYTNLRNAAAGMIKNEDIPPQIIEKYLDIIPFHLYEIKKQNGVVNAIKKDAEAAKHIYTINQMEIIPNIKIENTEVAEAVYELMDYISNGLGTEHLKSIVGADIYNTLTQYPYECDGVIVTKMGVTGKVNDNNELEGVMALKFSAPTQDAIIKEIKTSMNKSNISFVVEIEPVRIGGVTVTNVSGAVKEVKDMETFLQIYRPGQKIQIARSGGVIPNLLAPNDVKSLEIYEEVADKSKKLVELLTQKGLIKEDVKQDFINAINLGFSDNYNSTSKVYWMDFKVKAIYNAIINDKEPFKNALKSILEILVKKQKLLNEKEVLQEIDNLTKNFKPVLDIVKQTSISLPTDCPSCGSALVKSETGKQLSCVNEECPTRRTSKLTTYLIDLQSGGNKTNIDDRKMEALLVYIQRTLYKEGERQSIVRDIIKLYEIADDKEIVSKLIQYSDETKYDENPLAFKDKRAEKFVADILITKGSKESDFLGAIGIDNFKSSTARKLLRKISLQRLLDYDYSEPNKKLLMEEIMTIPDFAEKTAELVVSFFAENKEDIQELHQKVNPVKEEVKVVEGAKIIQMTGTGSISWEFFQALTPNDMAVTKGVLYKDIPVSDNGANKEIKEVLKRESMVFQYNDENIKLIGGNNPTGKTDIVMSDKLSAAVSKAKALKNTFTFDDIENQSQKKQFEQLLSNGFKSQEGTKICVLTDTKVMISFFTGGKTLKQEQTQVVDKQTTLNRTI